MSMSEMAMLRQPSAGKFLVRACNAYTFLSHEPTYATPFATVGEENT
jgi:hypothetical protein